MQVNNVSNTTQVVSQTNKTTETKKSSATSFDSYLNSTKKVSLEDIFKQAADKYNVSVDLLKAIGKQESNFNPNAVSKSGAQGVMQLMPFTAKELGVTDSFDAEQNIMGGAKLISKLLDQYGGDTKLALAAYNAGSGNVKKYGGIPPFKETQNYVVKVMKYYQENLDASGVTVTSTNGSSNQTNAATTSEGNTKINTTTPVVEDAKIINQISNLDELSERLDEIFSMDDYLRLMDIMFGNDEESEKEQSNNQVYSQLGMSTPIINMFRGI